MGIPLYHLIVIQMPITFDLVSENTSCLVNGKPCYNGGTCHVSSSGYYCTCGKGRGGDNCEIGKFLDGDYLKSVAECRARRLHHSRIFKALTLLTSHFRNSNHKTWTKADKQKKTKIMNFFWLHLLRRLNRKTSASSQEAEKDFKKSANKFFYKVLTSFMFVLKQTCVRITQSWALLIDQGFILQAHMDVITTCPKDGTVLLVLQGNT